MDFYVSYISQQFSVILKHHEIIHFYRCLQKLNKSRLSKFDFKIGKLISKGIDVKGRYIVW
jgi:hypothetical protein